jgi:hypothetical protein
VGHPAALTATGRLCFLGQQRYDKHVLLGAVVDVLRSGEHRVGVLRPHGEVADRRSPLEATA